MKLNLLPTSASRGAGSRVAWVLCVVIIAASFFMAFAIKKAGNEALETAKNDASQFQSKSDQVVQISQEADDTMTKASGPLLNVQLAESMLKHNSVYPDFYDEVLRHVPGYFRLTSLQATPIDGNTCTVTMTGTISTFQQYADLMLALLRIPGAQAVSRAGYQLNELYVPPLDQTDQKGRPVMTGHARLPDDPIQRLDIQMAEAGHTDYSGVGGFGVPGTPMQRGATPKESLITVAVVVAKNLLTPNPRATLSGGTAAFGPAPGAAEASATTGGPGGAPGGGPGGAPPGPPGNFGGPPGVPNISRGGMSR